MRDVLAMVLTLALVVATAIMLGVGSALLRRSCRRLGALEPAVWSELSTRVRHDTGVLAEAIDRGRPSGLSGP